MKIYITSTIDVEAVYALCVPTSRKICNATIRRLATLQLERRANDADNGWVYPSAEWLAATLIESGMAMERLV